LAAPGVLAAGATVVLERPKGGAPVALPAGWDPERERVYGDTVLVVART
jgi:hypothetical protein